MNNEKQHSEYKIIETVATPTFDGLSVETHPEDQLGGGEPPKNILENGLYKFNLIGTGAGYYFAGQVIDGHVLVYSSSLGGVDNLCIYAPNGRKLASDVSDLAIPAIRKKCEAYENFVDINKEVNLEEQLDNFDTYIEL